MVKYLFEMKLHSVEENNEHFYTLDLSPSQEDNPDKIFTQEICERLRRSLQEQSSCQINDANLGNIVQTWLKDIQVGHRHTIMTLKLPLIILEKLSTLQEKGNQDLPPMFSPDINGFEPMFGALPPLDFV